MKKNAVVLLSGGLDSTTTLAIAHKLGYKIHALTFQYGQRHKHEIDSAKKIANLYNVEKHFIAKIDLSLIGGSALTDDINVPTNRADTELDNEIPITYVPARNTIFLSFALAWAEVIPANDIFIGINAVDYSGYPDCRPEFLEAYQKLANLATKAGVEGKLQLKIQAPLLRMTKSEIISRGLELGVKYENTTTCYQPSQTGIACGICDACILRKKGFSDINLKDPIKYQ